MRVEPIFKEQEINAHTMTLQNEFPRLMRLQGKMVRWAALEMCCES